MAKVPVDFLIGFLLGCVFSIAYYDGTVSREYKEKIQKASDSLKRAGQEINSKEMENQILLRYIEEMRAYDAKIFKNI